MRKSGLKVMSINNITLAPWPSDMLSWQTEEELGLYRASGCLIWMSMELCVTWECHSTRSVPISQRLRTAAMKSLWDLLLALQMEKFRDPKREGSCPSSQWLHLCLFTLHWINPICLFHRVRSFGGIYTWMRLAASPWGVYAPVKGQITIYQVKYEDRKNLREFCRLRRGGVQKVGEEKEDWHLSWIRKQK